MARIAVLVVLCLPLTLAPGAAAQSTPFDPVQPAPQQPPPPPPPPEEDEGLGDTELLLISLAGVLLVSAIAFGIVRDARRSAPQESHAALDSEGRHVKGSRTPPKQRVKTSRAKAKTARRARKRNR